MNSLDQLKQAFVESIGVNANGNFEDLAYGSTPGWDSIAHMALVANIESKFDIMLATDDVIGMSSFEKTKELLGKYGVSV